MEPYGIIWDGAIREHIGTFGTKQDPTEPYGTMLDGIKPYGTIQDQDHERILPLKIDTK